MLARNTRVRTGGLSRFSRPWRCSCVVHLVEFGIGSCVDSTVLDCSLEWQKGGRNRARRVACRHEALSSHCVESPPAFPAQENLRRPWAPIRRHRPPAECRLSNARFAKLRECERRGSRVNVDDRSSCDSRSALRHFWRQLRPQGCSWESPDSPRVPPQSRRSPPDSVLARVLAGALASAET
jgi:hypothetical protein